VVISSEKDRRQQTFLRINGVSPDFSRIAGRSESNEITSGLSKAAPGATSCSIISRTVQSADNPFHMLVDIGPGIVSSLSTIPDSSVLASGSSKLPDALLITHSHEDHIHDLPTLAHLYNTSRRLQVFCTAETRDRLRNKFESQELDTGIQFNIITPGQKIEVGCFSVTPISVLHYDYNSESPLPGCVIYVIQLPDKKKIVVGWDFLSINDVDENLLWNPDILLLGTETYNPHPLAGTISITEAFDFIRRWNAKQCYLVHYSGLLDREDIKNQWFRGPVKTMSPIELQNTIDNQLKLSGGNGKYRMTVAHEGMIWWCSTDERERSEPSRSVSTETSIEIESLRNFILKVQNLEADNKLNLEIEDSINRYSLEFASPHTDKNNNAILYGDPVKGSFAKGPQLRLEIIMESSDSSIIYVEILRGKKYVFNDRISIGESDAIRLRNFIKQNFKNKY
jgi:phosphoribosyl 1,2-cyclic phosphodiesterase